MKLKISLLKLALLVLISPHITYGMYTIFGSPVIYFPSPRYATKDLKTIGVAVSDYRANKSYNHCGQEVGLLAYNGPETLFKRFFDPSLPLHDTQSVGKALISGSLRFIDVMAGYDQNIGQNFFFEIATSLTYICLKHLHIQPVHDNCVFLSQAEIDADKQLTNYLAKLDTFINTVSSCGSFHDATVGPSYFTIGYAQNYQNFKHIDYIDFSVQAGFALPEKNLESTSTNILFNIATNDIRSIRLPLQASATMGLYDWLNVGITGAMVAYAPTTQRIPLPTSSQDCNIIFLPEQGCCKIYTRPLIYAGAYMQAEHFIPRVSLLAGISYSKQFKTTYQSLDKKFSNEVINACPVNTAWDLLNLTFSAEFDCADEDRPNLPLFRFVYVVSVHGKSTFKTSALSGQCGCCICHCF